MAPDVDMRNDPGEDWVRITSADGHSFLMKRKIASGTLKNMLDADSARLCLTANLS